jgi:hypothetical protein
MVRLERFVRVACALLAMTAAMQALASERSPPPPQDTGRPIAIRLEDGEFAGGADCRLVPIGCPKAK